MSSANKFPIPDRAASLRKGAAFIEQELHPEQLRVRSPCRRHQLRPFAVWMQLTSHEADLMQAVDLAVAATTLRMLAEGADS